MRRLAQHERTPILAAPTQTLAGAILFRHPRCICKQSARPFFPRPDTTLFTSSTKRASPARNRRLCMGWSLINRRMEASSLPPGAMAESCCAFSRRVSGRLPRVTRLSPAASRLRHAEAACSAPLRRVSGRLPRATRLSPAVTHRRRAAAACYAPSRPVTGRLPGIISSCVLTAEAGGEATIDGVPFAAKTRGLFGGEVQCAGRTVETRTRAWYGIEHILTPRLGSDRIITQHGRTPP